jgi:hypothetical protein
MSSQVLFLKSIFKFIWFMMAAVFGKLHFKLEYLVIQSLLILKMAIYIIP